MLKLRHALLLLLLVFLSLPSRAEIAVIIHPDSPLKNLSAREISDLYLGRKRTLEGEKIQVLDLVADNPLRERFFALLNGMDQARLNAYWARLQFSGDLQPPPQLANGQAMLNAISHNRLAIGYINAAQVGSGVRTLLLLERK